jgi:hypothetical protein
MECMFKKSLTAVECNRLRKLRKHSRHLNDAKTLADNEIEKKISQLVNCVIRKIEYTVCKQRYGIIK